ncbi:MAG: GIY-YIG nuclease family protein [Bacteroidia bacterium]|nr:GIY-YIG nuclease family protein [Bacteroidia bacterium]
MATCYVLFSRKLNRYYVGYTTGLVSDRLQKHNTATHGNHRFTAKADDWEVFLEIVFENNSEAILAERYIKQMKSRVYIEKLKMFPEEIDKLRMRIKN